MAVVRNSSHVGASGLCRMLQLPVSRQSVERWERLCAVSVVLQARSYYRRAHERCVSSRSRPGALSWSCLNVRGDATSFELLKVFHTAVDSVIRDAHGYVSNRRA